MQHLASPAVARPSCQTLGLQIRCRELCVSSFVVVQQMKSRAASSLALRECRQGCGGPSVKLGRRTTAAPPAVHPFRLRRLPVFAVSEPSARFAKLWRVQRDRRAVQGPESNIFNGALCRSQALLKPAAASSRRPSLATVRQAVRPCCAPARIRTPTPGTASACALSKVATSLSQA